MKLVCSIFCAWLLAAAPVFGLSLDQAFTDDGGLPLVSVMDSDMASPVLFDAYTVERSRAGTVFVEPVIIEEVVEAPLQVIEDVDTAEELIFLPVSPPVELDPYLSAGPDGYGIAGFPTALGTEDITLDDAVFEWSQINGPIADIEYPFEPATWFTASRDGIYTFLLSARLGNGEQLFDSAVFVVDDPGINYVPTAFAGDDEYIEIKPDQPIFLMGTGFDADDDELSFSWKQSGGPDATLYFSGSALCEFYPEVEGSYTFSLTVNDGRTDSLPDELNLVCYLPINLPPVAVTEDRQVYESAGTVVLDGSESFDQDGDVIGFIWEQIDGRPVTLSDSEDQQPIFTAQHPGDYWFKLTVDDGKTKSLPVEVNVHIDDPANAAADTAFGCTPRNTFGGLPILLFILAVLVGSVRVSRSTATGCKTA